MEMVHWIGIGCCDYARAGPADKRPATLNPNWGGVIEPNTFGTHEFLDFAQQIGAEAYISVNVGSGTPQEAAEWLEYMTADKPSALAQERAASDSGRQIISFYVPGDIPDANTLHLPRMDHNLIGIGPAVVGFIPHDAVHAALAQSSALLHALWRETLIDAAVLRQWVVNLGQRESTARVAHVLCELAVRLDAVGLLRDRSLPIPWTRRCRRCHRHTPSMPTADPDLRTRAWCRVPAGQIVDWGSQRVAGFSPDYCTSGRVVADRAVTTRRIARLPDGADYYSRLLVPMSLSRFAPCWPQTASITMRGCCDCLEEGPWWTHGDVAVCRMSTSMCHHQKTMPTALVRKSQDQCERTGGEAFRGFADGNEPAGQDRRVDWGWSPPNTNGRRASPASRRTVLCTSGTAHGVVPDRTRS